MTEFDAVLHLITDDIYLDIRFTAWTVGLGGGFAYDRAMAPVASGADFNGDGNVDGLDLAIWENHFGATGATQGEGDANLDGTVDGADFLIWQQEFAGTQATTTVVPEPSGLLLLGVCGMIGAFGRQRRLAIFCRK